MNFFKDFNVLSTKSVDKTKINKRFSTLVLASIILVFISYATMAIAEKRGGITTLEKEHLFNKALAFEKESKNQLTHALNPMLKSNNDNPAAKAKGVMVFVSLVMPDTSLKQFLKQSEALQVPLIVRGVLPQGFPATVKRMNTLIQNNGKTINSGFAINPKWFTQFGIKQVPAFGFCRIFGLC